MKITLKTMSKEEHSVEVAGPDSTIGELRQASRIKLSTSEDKILTLVHTGTVLAEDAKTLSEAGIAEGALVIAVEKKAPAGSAASPAQAPVPQPTAPQPAAPQPASSPAPTPAPAASTPSADQPMGERITVTVANVEGDVRMAEVEPNETVENLKAILEVEFGVPLASQQLFFESKMLANAQKLNEAGVKDNDMLMMQVLQAPRPTAGAGGQGAGNPGLLGNLMQALGNPLQRYMEEANQLLQMAQQDPHFIKRIEDQNKPMADAIKKGDPNEVAKELANMQKARRENELKKAQAIARLNADPLDIEAQKEIEEAIRMENVNQNLETAMEYNPEAFARVVMLYVDSEVNGVPVKAFVDSGAQSTIMSQPCAQRLGLMRLIDHRYAGVAKGVGTSKIVGKVHAVNMKIGKSYFTVAITVLEDNSMEFLFGLDNLRRHQMCIDLKDNVLRFGEDAVPFLGEGDIPLHLRSEGAGEDQAMDVEDSAASAGASGATGAPPNQPAGGTQAPSASGAGTEFPQEAVDGIVAMGFTKEQALMALRSANGNADVAVALLFGGD